MCSSTKSRAFLFWLINNTARWTKSWCNSKKRGVIGVLFRFSSVIHFFVSKAKRINTRYVVLTTLRQQYKVYSFIGVASSKASKCDFVHLTARTWKTLVHKSPNFNASWAWKGSGASIANVYQMRTLTPSNQRLETFFLPRGECKNEKV